MTKIAKPNEIKREWIVLDAEGKIFGRLLTEVAAILRGKNKPYFTPNVDCGDYVKSEKFGDLLEKNPVKLYKLAVRGMLPKTNLGRAMLKKLKIYSGSEHPHTAQLAKEGK